MYTCEREGGEGPGGLLEGGNQEGVISRAVEAAWRRRRSQRQGSRLGVGGGYGNKAGCCWGTVEYKHLRDRS